MEELEYVGGADVLDDMEPYVVSASVFAVIQSTYITDDVFNGMIDAGANVSIGPRQLATALGVTIHPPTDVRKIGTADKAGQLVISGWMYLEGYTGPIAIVEGAAFLLLSTSQMQKHGMGVEFPADQMVCHLSTKDGWFVTLEQCCQTRLYFIDVRRLWAAYCTPYIRQPGDAVLGPDSIQGGWAGCVSIAANSLVVAPSSKHKRGVPASVIFRVWKLHKRLYHANMDVVACDIASGRIVNADVTPE